MQKFKFPMEFLRVTQGENDNYSHAGSLAMDFGGLDGGSDKLYCPCDMIVKRARQNANGELYLESTEKVLFADNTVDYAHLLLIHDNQFNVSEGQIIPQGAYFYDEGGMGSGKPYTFANHVHIEGGKGKWNSCKQFVNSKGVYVSENMTSLYNLFCLGRDVEILNGGGYKWKYADDVYTNEEFLQLIGTAAKADNERSGINGSLTVAQAILESGWGRSGLTTISNNLFGIKGEYNGEYVMYPTTEWDGEKYIDITAKFKKYPSFTESLADHSDMFLRLERYSNLIDCTDYKTACRLVQKDGYATAPDYADKLINLIEQYDLTRFDVARKASQPDNLPEKPSENTDTGKLPEIENKPEKDENSGDNQQVTDKLPASESEKEESEGGQNSVSDVTENIFVQIFKYLLKILFGGGKQ